MTNHADLIARLRGMPRYAHDDKSIGDEAAGEIERLRSIWREAAEAATMHQAEVLRLRDLLRECRLALVWSSGADDAFILRLGAAIGDDE